MIAQIVGIQNEVINESISGYFALLAGTYIITLYCLIIWSGIVKPNGETIKNYRIYEIIAAIGLAVVSYFTVDDYTEMKISDIPTLLGSIIFTGAAIEFYIYWKKKKGKS